MAIKNNAKEEHIKTNPPRCFWKFCFIKTGRDKPMKITYGHKGFYF